MSALPVWSDPVANMTVSDAGPRARGLPPVFPDLISLDDLQICVLDVHGLGLPNMDWGTAPDWAVKLKFGYDCDGRYCERAHRCSSSILGSMMNDLRDGPPTAYWSHCCATFPDVVVWEDTQVTFELFDVDNLGLHDSLCCSASVPLLAATGSGPYTARLSGGDSRYLDVRLSFERGPSPPPPKPPPRPPISPRPPPLPPRPPRTPPGTASCDATWHPPSNKKSSANGGPPDGCWVIGPPWWGARPQCLLGPLLELFGGQETLPLPNAYFDGWGNSNWVEVEIPVSGTIKIKSLVASHLVCSYIRRAPFSAEAFVEKDSSLLSQTSPDSGRRLRIAIHIKEMTCTAVIHGDEASGLVAHHLSDSSMTIDLGDIKIGAEIFVGFEADDDGNLIQNLGFADPACKPTKSCSCRPLDMRCPVAGMSIGRLEVHVFDTEQSSNTGFTNELMRAVTPMIRTGLVEAIVKQNFPRHTKLATPPEPRNESADGGAGCVFSEGCRLFNLVSETVLSGPFSPLSVFHRMGEARPPRNDEPRATELVLDTPALAALAEAMLGSSPLTSSGGGIVVDAAPRTESGLAQFELVELNLTVADSSFMSLIFGYDLNATLDFEFLEVRAAANFIWLPTAEPEGPRLGGSQARGYELDPSKAIKQRIQFGMVGKNFTTSTQSSLLHMHKGASVFACAMLKLGLQDFSVDGDVNIHARAAGGDWEEDAAAFFNELLGFVLTNVNALPASGVAGSASLTHALSGSVLRQLLTAEECASVRPCGSETLARDAGDGEASSPSGSWMNWLGVGHAFGMVVNFGLSMADLAALQPIFLRFGDEALRLAPTGTLLDGATWKSSVGASALYRLLPNADRPSIRVSDVTLETRLHAPLTKLEVEGGGDTAHLTLKYLDARVSLELLLPKKQSQLGSETTIKTSARLRLRDVSVAAPLRLYPADDAGFAARGAVRPWMLSVGGVMGGVSCVHARVSGGAPTLSATVEALDISEGVARGMDFLERTLLDEPIPLELLSPWAPFFADLVNEMAALTEQDAGGCSASGPASAIPLWALMVGVVALLTLLVAGLAYGCTKLLPKQGGEPSQSSGEKML